MGRLRNYLRIYRRRWHLTEEELAFLLGHETASFVARLEHEERAVTLAVVYGCQQIFGAEPREIFPAVFESIEEEILHRAHELRGRLLQSRPTQGTLAKLELLQEALGRMSVLPEQQEV